METLGDDDLTAVDWACVTLFLIVDFPLTFTVDTVLLPVDLFALRLHGKSLHDLKGFVVLEEGYSLIWQDRPCVSKGERKIDVPALHLRPEGASGGTP